MPSHHRYAETRLREGSAAIDVSRTYRDFDLNYSAVLPADRKARILDLGSGLGHFLDWLASLGYSNRLGIDVSADCVQAVVLRHPAELVDDTTKFLTDRAGQFDLIVMRNVIAHLPPDETVPLLAAAHRALVPNGGLLVETFNGALPTAEYTLSNDFTHRRMFTEASLRQVLRLADFVEPEIRPMLSTRSGARGRLYGGLRAVYTRWLQLKFILERGAGNNPAIFEKSLLAIATRRA